MFYLHLLTDNEFWPRHDFIHLKDDCVCRIKQWRKKCSRQVCKTAPGSFSRHDDRKAGCASQFWFVLLLVLRWLLLCCPRSSNDPLMSDCQVARMTGACDQPYLTLVTVNRGTKLGQFRGMYKVCTRIKFFYQGGLLSIEQNSKLPVTCTHTVPLTSVQTYMAAPLCSISLAALASFGMAMINVLLLLTVFRGHRMLLLGDLWLGFFLSLPHFLLGSW